MSMRHFTLVTLTATLLALGSLSSSAAEDPKTQHEHKMHMDDQEMSIDHQVEMARSAADHEAVAKRLDDEATLLEKQAGEHERLAKRYRSGMGVGPKTNAASLAAHCDKLVKSLRASAAEVREMAQLHRDLAKHMAN
jgi:hypothetical protein